MPACEGDAFLPGRSLVRLPQRLGVAKTKRLKEIISVGSSARR